MTRLSQSEEWGIKMMEGKLCTYSIKYDELNLVETSCGEIFTYLKPEWKFCPYCGKAIWWEK